MTFVHVIILVGIAFAIGAYFLLFHDDIMEKRNDALRLLQNKSEAEKIAKVKALSTNPKDLEKFIIDNAKTLSDATIDILVARLEMLAADRVIRDDDLKARIDTVVSASEPEDAAAPPEQKASRRKK